MSVLLEIQDGVPHWWNSPDLWVVPGGDPNGVPGQPVSGEMAYVWAKVHNRGKDSADDAKVNFYWSNPATGVLRSNSTLIGYSFVSLNAGETKDVLCVTPWIPVVVNNGHECLVAEVIHPADPLPAPVTDEFAPQLHRQVAQKNLNVITMKDSGKMYSIQLSAPKRKKADYLVRLEIGGELQERNLVNLGLRGFHVSKNYVLNAGLTLHNNCAEMKNNIYEKEIRLSLSPGVSKPVYIKLVPEKIEENCYVLINVISESREGRNGGITYILINEKGGKQL